MLIVALVLAVIGLAALVTAVVTSNELIAWICIGASVIGVLLLIVDALRERSRGDDGEAAAYDEVEGVDGGGDVREDGDGHRDDETTVMPAMSDPDAAEDYPAEPAEGTEVRTPDITAQDETVDPADDDPPTTTIRT